MDLWTAKFRDWSAKKWLRQMLEWHTAIKHNWIFYPKNDGKEMKEWLDPSLWDELHHCFGRFDSNDSWQSLYSTIQLYRKIAKQTATHLNYSYNLKLDTAISDFISRLRK